MRTSARFLEMTLEYPTIFVSDREFAIKLDCKRYTTVRNWLDGTTKELNATSRVKVAEIFGLNPEVWTDLFNRASHFRASLKNYKNIVAKDETVIEEILFGSLLNIEEKEKKMLEKELESDINLDKEMKNKSPNYMFAFAEKLKKDNRATEALKVLNMIEEHPSNYKYDYHNQIEHKKAILLSHDTINGWDGAINILKRLYRSAKYHNEEPEIITLIASNYKRKALFDKDNNLLSKKHVDINLLVNAITLYKEAYNIKDSQAKYYDAINFAYLHNITDAIEVEYADKTTIITLYKELTTGKEKWRLDSESWWEVTSNAEFLMLLGRVQEANMKINEFLDFHFKKLTEFDINATLRQLEIYIHFTEDKSAVEFKDNLLMGWEALKSNSKKSK